MIEPLRFTEEFAPTFNIKRPIFCGYCISKGKKGKDLNIAIKFCTDCEKYFFQCLQCDQEIHRIGGNKKHMRRSIVIGPGIRKEVITRGDAINFPLTLDDVHIKVEASVFNQGKVIHKEPSRHMTYVAGLSGKCVHVQVLGARNLIAADLNGTSDPFIVGMYCGKKLGATRVRPRTLNPNWNNETFIVPVSDNLPDARNMAKTQKDLFRLEVYDYDWFTQNDLLGNVELTKAQLVKLATMSDKKPIRLKLTSQEFHGIIGVSLGMNREHLCLKLNRAESLDKGNPTELSNPYAKIYFDGNLLGKTPILRNTIDPQWTTGNQFFVKINDVLQKERILLKKKSLFDTLQRNLNQARSRADDSWSQSQSNSHAHSHSDSQHTFRQHRNDTRMFLNGTQSNPIHASSVGSMASLLSHDDSSVALDAKEMVLFRVEIYHSSSKSHFAQNLFQMQMAADIHLGSTDITVEYLRKMLPKFPTKFVTTKVAEEVKPTPMSPLNRMMSMLPGRSPVHGYQQLTSPLQSPKLTNTPKLTKSVSSLFGTMERLSSKLFKTELSPERVSERKQLMDIKVDEEVDDDDNSSLSSDGIETDNTEKEPDNRELLIAAGVISHDFDPDAHDSDEDDPEVHDPVYYSLNRHLLQSRGKSETAMASRGTMLALTNPMGLGLDTPVSMSSPIQVSPTRTSKLTFQSPHSLLNSPSTTLSLRKLYRQTTLSSRTVHNQRFNFPSNPNSVSNTVDSGDEGDNGGDFLDLSQRQSSRKRDAFTVDNMNSSHDEFSQKEDSRPGSPLKSIGSSRSKKLKLPPSLPPPDPSESGRPSIMIPISSFFSQKLQSSASLSVPESSTSAVHAEPVTVLEVQSEAIARVPVPTLLTQNSNSSQSSAKGPIMPSLPSFNSSKSILSKKKPAPPKKPPRPSVYKLSKRVSSMTGLYMPPPPVSAPNTSREESKPNESSPPPTSRVLFSDVSTTSPRKPPPLTSSPSPTDSNSNMSYAPYIPSSNFSINTIDEVSTADNSQNVSIANSPMAINFTLPVAIAVSGSDNNGSRKSSITSSLASSTTNFNFETDKLQPNRRKESTLFIETSKSSHSSGSQTSLDQTSTQGSSHHQLNLMLPSALDDKLMTLHDIEDDEDDNFSNVTSAEQSNHITTSRSIQVSAASNSEIHPNQSTDSHSQSSEHNDNNQHQDNETSSHSEKQHRRHSNASRRESTTHQAASSVTQEDYSTIPSQFQESLQENSIDSPQGHIETVFVEVDTEPNSPDHVPVEIANVEEIPDEEEYIEQLIQNEIDQIPEGMVSYDEMNNEADTYGMNSNDAEEQVYAGWHMDEHGEDEDYDDEDYDDFDEEEEDEDYDEDEEHDYFEFDDKLPLQSNVEFDPETKVIELVDPSKIASQPKEKAPNGPRPSRFSRLSVYLQNFKLFNAPKASTGEKKVEFVNEDIKDSDGTFKWSRIRHFRVMKDSDKNLAEAGADDDRGYVIVRLILSNRGGVLSGIDEAVRHMTLGETAAVMVRYDFGYGNYCIGFDIPPRSNMVYKIKLISINKSSRVQVLYRLYRRLQRFLTHTYHEYRYHAAEWKKRRPMLRFCQSLYQSIHHLIYPPPKVEQTKVDEEMDENGPNHHISITGSHDTKSIATSRQSYLDISIDPKMKKYVNRSVVLGNRFLWGYRPMGKGLRENNLKNKDKKNKDKKKEANKELLNASNALLNSRRQLSPNGKIRKTLLQSGSGSKPNTPLNADSNSSRLSAYQTGGGEMDTAIHSRKTMKSFISMKSPSGG